MDTNNLKSIPLLLEKNEALINKVDKMLSVSAQVLLERPKAEISSEELHKVQTVIENTHCAMPDTTEISRQIAMGTLVEIKDEVGNAIKHQVGDMHLQLEHTHVHTTASELAELADEKCKEWLKILIIICGALLLFIIGGAFWYTNSEGYWGKRYINIARSDYITVEEKNLLWEGIRFTGALPKEYYSNPDFAKSKIKQNESVIRERERQARSNNNEWEPTVPIERTSTPR